MSRKFTWVFLFGVCNAIALGDNIIYVTGGTENTDYTIDQVNATVQLLQPHTSGTAYTIWADDDTTSADLGDGYINAITLDSRTATSNEDYEVRIARLVTGTTYSYGAKYVGYVDISDGDHRRGFLGTVLVKGQWGKKVVNGSVVDVDPIKGETTELFQAGVHGEAQPRFQIDAACGDAESGSIAACARLIVGVGSGTPTSAGWSLRMTLERDFRGTLETRGGADINGTPDGLDSLIIGRDLTGTIKSQENISAKIVVRRDMSGAIVANEDGDSAQTGQGSIVRDILIMRNFTGSIKALTRSGAGGRFDGHIDVGGDFVGSQNAAALIQAQGGIGPKSCVQLNYDGALPGTWNSTYASVVLGPTTYRSGNESAGVRYIDHRGGIEMDFNGSAGDFSIDPLTGCFVERHTADDESTHQNTAPPVLPAHK